MMSTIRYKEVLFSLICLLGLFSCDSNKHEDDSREGINQKKDPISVKSGTIKASNSFKEFVLRKKEIDLNIYPSRDNGLFDPKEMITVNVELFNPRHLAFRNYKNNLNSDTIDFVFMDVFIGTEKQSWTEYLSLSVSNDSDNEQENVSFSTSTVKQKQIINIGKGEIGSCQLLIRPGYFAENGELKLNLNFRDSDSETKLNAETSIFLENGLMPPLILSNSEVKYLLASDKTKQAIELASQTVNKWPESYNARLMLGAAYEKDDQPDKALVAYRKSLSLFNNEEQNQLSEIPIGLYQKIKVMEDKHDYRK